VFTAQLKLTYYPQRSGFIPTSGQCLYSLLKSIAPSLRRFTVFASLLFFAFAPPEAFAQDNPISKRVERAAAMIRDNRVGEAEQELNLILKASPKEAAALNLLGAVRAKQGRLDEAETLFLRAIRSDNLLTGAHMNLAYLYLLKGAPEKTALELKEVLQLDPNNAEATYRLAWLLLSQARFDQCIKFIKEAEQGRTLSPPVYAVLGDAYLKKGDLDQAEKSYLQALGTEGGNRDALLGMALVSGARGGAKSAAGYLSRAKERIENSPDLLYRFALVALNLNSTADAVSAIKKAIEINPAEPSYHFVLGLAWLKKPDIQEAEQAFRQSLKLKPGSSSAQMHLGYTLLKQKKNPEAREWLERSIQKESPVPESFYYLGLIAQDQNEDDRAVKLFEKAIELSPSFANAHIALGSTYLKLKNYPRAQQELEAGVKLSPADSKAHYNLAILYARLKDPERAQAEMRIVEKLKIAGKAQEKEGDIPAPSAISPR
jgi:Flp pilus assembly protein TadD